LCGKTNHLTNFAILLGGQSSDDPCKEGENYFTGDALSDSMIVLGVVIFVVLLGVIIIVAFTFIPPLKRLLYGKEGMRVHTVNARRKSNKSDIEMGEL